MRQELRGQGRYVVGCRAWMGWGAGRSPHLSVALLELPTGIPLCPFQPLQPGPQLTGFLLSCHLGLLK